MRSVILASASPRRRELLSLLGWPFSVRVSSIEEVIVPSESPQDAVVRLATEKARSVHSSPEDMVIAADTVVVLDGAILGKPSSKDEAFEMVKSLAGRSHLVMTGVAVAQGNRVVSDVEITSVFFRDLDDDRIRAYVETREGMDKAGAYGIQGLGALLVSRIEGDYFNVVGLPLHRLSIMVGSFGCSLESQWGVDL
nr:Maf family protein [uncultured Dethiosulfovibrio sp.]